MCPFSSPMATLRLWSIKVSMSVSNAVNILRNRANLWSESTGEKATAVAASAVLMTATEVHFPS